MRDNDLKMQLGAAIRRLRLGQGISQTGLAQRAKVPRTYLVRLEAGKRNLTLRTLARLAQGLDAPMAAFFLNGTRAPVALRNRRSRHPGLVIRELRHERRHTQESFAKAARLNRAYFAGVEAGKRNLTLRNLDRIAVGLGVPISTLFGVETPGASPSRSRSRCA